MENRLLNEVFKWQCPTCHKPLNEVNNQWRCENKHSFDIAKEGYVNLLLAQHKNSKMPGDSKEMVLARRAFLSQNHYLPLALGIGDLLQQFVSLEEQNNKCSKQFKLFDAGCGEGYYLQTIVDQIHATTSNINACGIDISKAAIQKASRKNKISTSQTHFAVASCFNIPLTDNSQHAVIQVFAPSSANEIARVLQIGGIWILVNPASDHLYELKELVYRSPNKHEVDNIVVEGFTLLSQTTIGFNILLNDRTQRENLLLMTPFYWTISPDKKQYLLDELTQATAHFDIKVMRKEG